MGWVVEEEIGGGDKRWRWWRWVVEEEIGGGGVRR